MKIKSLLSCFLAAGIFVAGSIDASAQQRKSGTTQKRTTSSTARKSTSAGTSGSALKTAQLENNKYLCCTDLQQNDQWLITFLSLDAGGNAIWDAGDKIPLNWKVNGNALLVYNSSKTIFNLTSNNSGKSFTGTVNGKSKTYAYDMTASHGASFNFKKFVDGVNDNKYYVFILCNPKKGDLDIGFQGTAKFNEDDDESGSLKLNADNKLMAGIGVLKFDYEVEDNSLALTRTDGKETKIDFTDMTDQFVKFDLGPSKVGPLKVYFVKK